MSFIFQAILLSASLPEPPFFFLLFFFPQDCIGPHFSLLQRPPPHTKDECRTPALSRCMCVRERKVNWCEITYSHFCLLIQCLVIQKNARCMLLKYKQCLFPKRMTFRMPGGRCKLSKQLQKFIFDLSTLSLAFSKKWLCYQKDSTRSRWNLYRHLILGKKK